MSYYCSLREILSLDRSLNMPYTFLMGAPGGGMVAHRVAKIPIWVALASFPLSVSLLGWWNLLLVFRSVFYSFPAFQWYIICIYCQFWKKLVKFVGKKAVKVDAGVYYCMNGLKGNWHFFQPGPYFSIHFYLTEWWYFQFLNLLLSRVRDCQSFWILAPSGRYFGVFNAILWGVNRQSTSMTTERFFFTLCPYQKNHRV